MTDNNKNKKLLTRMNKNQFDTFKKIAKRRDEKRSVLVRQWIDDYINEHGNKKELTYYKSK
ncbi:hypothetical protein [Oceanobacillus luteolus]|uniref:Ribbon-helix-helix protein CopG domain-containing protein n=1 Tax=Oceanobacillus luteolus TaxID=1274358 RepID=A0ABW4HSK9_9BACI